MKPWAEQIQIGDVRVGGICAAEEGEYLLGDKYSTCMLNVDYALRECLSLCQVILLICT